MIIIVEGVDKVGKDTLIKNLRGYYDEVIKNERPKDSSLKEEEMLKNRYHILYVNAIKNCDGKNWIFNRSHISQMVYSGVMRKRDNMYDKDLMKMSDDIRQVPHCLVYLYNSDVGEIRTRLVKEKEEYINGDKLEKLHERYLEAIDKSLMTRIIVNTCGKTATEVYNIVRLSLKHLDDLRREVMNEHVHTVEFW